MTEKKKHLIFTDIFPSFKRTDIIKHYSVKVEQGNLLTEGSLSFKCTHACINAQKVINETIDKQKVKDAIEKTGKYMESCFENDAIRTSMIYLVIEKLEKELKL